MSSSYFQSGVSKNRPALKIFKETLPYSFNYSSRVLAQLENENSNRSHLGSNYKTTINYNASIIAHPYIPYQQQSISAAIIPSKKRNLSQSSNQDIMFFPETKLPKQNKQNRTLRQKRRQPSIKILLSKYKDYQDEIIPSSHSNNINDDESKKDNEKMTMSRSFYSNEKEFFKEESVKPSTRVISMQPRKSIFTSRLQKIKDGYKKNETGQLIINLNSNAKSVSEESYDFGDSRRTSFSDFYELNEMLVDENGKQIKKNYKGKKVLIKGIPQDEIKMRELEMEKMQLKVLQGPEKLEYLYKLNREEAKLRTYSRDSSTTKSRVEINTNYSQRSNKNSKLVKNNQSSQMKSNISKKRKINVSKDRSATNFEQPPWVNYDNFDANIYSLETIPKKKDAIIAQSPSIEEHVDNILNDT
ncbi:UNKNOWN [Stylonychia lemnae]|uniref:Uncharacterized protein n=1 Tax=Stylonychia lemnae TaxID=5949 RepID=A0A078ALR9_STYLE|nr:UNKNOWN [Stylonychia lemnae]|eukprot:CDW83174.1 UNKNOWN [Stylonychia lemnae]